MTFSSLVGERLKEARKSLGLKQAEVADAVGVTREYWGRCERGVSVPGGEVLAALASRGADVAYILTGQHAGGSKQASALTVEEEKMLGLFREASQEARGAALGALIGASSSKFEGSQQIFNKAIKGDVAGRDIAKGGGKR